MVDKILALNEGAIVTFGPRDEVVSTLTRPVTAAKAEPADASARLQAITDASEGKTGSTDDAAKSAAT
jgi:ABC-type glutathione transport system ATPase component